MREDHETSRSRSSWAWRALALLLAAVLFWAATSNAVYDITSPPALSWHVLLRKAYSIAAFALLGFSVERALGPSARAYGRAALLIGLYSGAIELAQARQGSHEGLLWNAVDVACGAAGGLLGAAATRIRRSRRSR